MVAKKKRTRMRPAPVEAALPPRKFVVFPASVVKFQHIEAMEGALYGLDEEGQVFAYVPTSEAWVRLDGDDNRVVFLRTPEDEPTIDESRFPEEIQKERAARAEKVQGREAWYLVHERVHEAIQMHAGWRLDAIDETLKRVLKALEKEKGDAEEK